MKKLFVIKIGGNIIDDENRLTRFLTSISRLQAPILVVHGGGKIATSIGDRLGIASNYIDGRRITDDQTLDLVTMVYGGLVNKKIVAQLQSLGVNALGLTGADLNLIPATKRATADVDYGWVGDVNTDDIRFEWLTLLIDLGVVPVLAPLTHDSHGHLLNTNADTIASSLAIALSKDYSVRLIYCFEKKGILEKVTDEDSVINHINKEKYQRLLQEQKLFAGILPKLENAFAAIDAGVNEVLIGDAADIIHHTGDTTTGTLITA